MKQENGNSLWLTFRVDGMDYCILSDYIDAITIPGHIEPMPQSFKGFAGMTTYSGMVLGVVEMRELFGCVNLKTYTEQFSMMKDMHVLWVEDLARYVHEGGEFKKSVDPHKCKFGIWYDEFHTDNNRLNRLLKKISTPHERIHRCGAEIMAMRERGGDNTAEILEKLDEADIICRSEIIPLLERLIDIYCAVNRGVLLVIRQDERRIGFLVDEVRKLVACNKTTYQDFNDGIKPNHFLRKMVVDVDNVLLEIDVEQILNMRATDKEK